MTETTPSQPSTAAAARLQNLLHGRIVPLIARLSAPNIAVVSAMTVVTIADAWFVSRIGVTALASLALVFPVQALMQMMSAGAMGGGVSSAVARALGAGKPERADAVVVHAVIIALAMAGIYVLFGAVLAWPLFALAGGSGAVLVGAVAYGQIAFGGAAAIWLVNTFASVLRGTGNMAFPAVVLVTLSAFQMLLSGAFTLGWGPFPPLGLRGPALALVTTFGLATLVMAGQVASGRGGVRLRLTGAALRWELFRDIIKVGGVACGNALLTIATVVVVTRLVARHGPAALAGYGLGSRLELMMVPLAFGIGGALTVAVGTNFGAGQYARARSIAWSGGLAVAFATGLVGIAVAAWPALWLSHFTDNAEAYGFGARYLVVAAPFYGFFGVGMALYFASQGTGNMAWPFTAGVVRLVVAAGGGAVATLWLGWGTTALFALVAAGMFSFGALLLASLFSRVWNPEAPVVKRARGSSISKDR